MVAEAQRLGGIAAFIDAEHALDPIYAKKLGVNIDELLISQPDTGEQALEIAETLVRSNAVDVIVVDSVAALVPRAELDGDMGDSLPGLQARLMSQALRKLTAAIARSGIVMIFINQIREKIGIMFGNPETQPGGRALKFYASVRIDVRRQDAIKQGTESLGVRTKAKVVKNKLAPPFREAEFDMIYGEGISKSGTILDAGVEQGMIEKSGTWYTFKSERIGQGRENAKKWLQDNPAVLADLEAKIRDGAGAAHAGPRSSKETLHGSGQPPGGQRRARARPTCTSSPTRPRSSASTAGSSRSPISASSARPSMEECAKRVLPERLFNRLRDGREVDAAYAVRDLGRFRVNMFLATGAGRGRSCGPSPPASRSSRS